MNDPNYYAEEYNSIGKEFKKIRILDSTLREGEQHPGVSFTVKQRIQIAWELDYFGVDQIEISPVIPMIMLKQLRQLSNRDCEQILLHMEEL
jgi:2-isopropylmalate synthase